MSSSTVCNNERKRRAVSSSNTRKLSRTKLISSSKNERINRSLSMSDPSNIFNDIKHEYSLSPDIIQNNLLSTWKPLVHSLDNSNDAKRVVNSNEQEIKSNENMSSSIHGKSTTIRLVVKSSMDNKEDDVATNSNKKTNFTASYSVEEDFNMIKQNTNKVMPVVITPNIPSLNPNNTGNIDQSYENSTRNSSNNSIKSAPVVQSNDCSSTIKLFPNGGGISPILRFPTIVQVTKTSSLLKPKQYENNSSIVSISTTNFLNTQEQLHDQCQSNSCSTLNLAEKRSGPIVYPLTPPPPIVDNKISKVNLLKKSTIHNKIADGPNSLASNENQIFSKRSASALSSNFAVTPISELSPKSLTSSSPDISQNNLTLDDVIVDSNLEVTRLLPNVNECRVQSSALISRSQSDQTKPIRLSYKRNFSSIVSNSENVTNQSLNSQANKRQQNYQINEKYSKSRLKNEQNLTSVINNLLTEMIERIESINSNTNSSSKILFGINNESHSVEKRSIDDSQSKLDNVYKTKSNRNGSITKVDDRKKPSTTNQPIDNTPMNQVSIELTRQTSTPLSFYSVGSLADEQSVVSPSNQSIVTKINILSDILDELIKGANGLDKLSCSVTAFTNTIRSFVRLNIEEQHEKVEDLQRSLEKKCSSELRRANLYCTEKVKYFMSKHSIITVNEYINEITLIVQYFYFYVLSLNCLKKECEFEAIISDLIHGKLTFINETFCSSALTSTIEHLISTSTFSNEYLLSQPITINDIEYSLPFIRNFELENELLTKNEICLTTIPFLNSNEMEEYLNQCEHVSTNAPYYVVQPSFQPSVYYSNYGHSVGSGQYYYSPTPSSDINPYYYSAPPSYSNCQQPYVYNHSSSYGNQVPPYSTTYNTNEQFNYYYNQQTSYTYQRSNSKNDIPLTNNSLLHHPYRRTNSNIQKEYNKSASENSSSMTVDTSNVTVTQSTNTTTNNGYQ